MIIDLNQEMEDQLTRVKDLADEAAQDAEQGFQSRAAAMSACSTMLAQLTKAQESLVTMERLSKVERCVIETVKEYLSEKNLEELLQKLEANLSQL
jgi:hypothetical protein